MSSSFVSLESPVEPERGTIPLEGVEQNYVTYARLFTTTLAYPANSSGDDPFD